MMNVSIPNDIAIPAERTLLSIPPFPPAEVIGRQCCRISSVSSSTFSTTVERLPSCVSSSLSKPGATVRKKSWSAPISVAR